MTWNLGWALYAALVGCVGDTGGARGTFSTVARSALAPDEARWEDDGWSVELTEAACAVGPIYLWSGASRLQGGVANDFEHGFLRGEVTEQAAVDLLARDMVAGDEVAVGEGRAIAGEARSAELWLAPPEGAAADALEGAGFRVAGTAQTAGGEPLRFAGTLTLDDALFSDPSTTATEQRKVRGIPFMAEDGEVAVLADGGTVLVEIDPRAWLDGADWSSLEALPADVDGVRHLVPGGAIHATWLRGVRQAEGPWTLSWAP